MSDENDNFECQNPMRTTAGFTDSSPDVDRKSQSSNDIDSDMGSSTDSSDTEAGNSERRDSEFLSMGKSAAALHAERGLYLRSTLKMLECYHQDRQNLESLIPAIDCALTTEATVDDMRSMLREVRAAIVSCYNPWAYSPGSSEPSGWLLKQANQVFWCTVVSRGAFIPSDYALEAILGRDFWSSTFALRHSIQEP